MTQMNILTKVYFLFQFELKFAFEMGHEKKILLKCKKSEKLSAAYAFILKGEEEADTIFQIMNNEAECL